jgi:hypothetical protein
VNVKLRGLLYIEKGVFEAGKTGVFAAYDAHYKAQAQSQGLRECPEK